MILARRKFLVGLLAAPIIVQAASIMRVRPLVTTHTLTADYPEDLFDYGNELGVRAGAYFSLFLHPSQVEALKLRAGSSTVIQPIPSKWSGLQFNV